MLQRLAGSELSGGAEETGVEYVDGQYRRRSGFFGRSGSDGHAAGGGVTAVGQLDGAAQCGIIVQSQVGLTEPVNVERVLRSLSHGVEGGGSGTEATMGWMETRDYGHETECGGGSMERGGDEQSGDGYENVALVEIA